MRKYLQIISVLGVFFLLIYLKNIKLFQNEENKTSVTAPNQNASPSSAQVTPAQTSMSTGTYKDGSYTGSTEDAFYGNVQVQAVISGGKIVDVIALQYPNDNGTSIEINSQAIPLLKQEALQAQSAQIDMLSGASETSPAFARSLANALAQAK